MDIMNGEIVKHGPFTYEKFPGWMELIDYDGDDEVVVVPEEVDGHTVCVHKAVFWEKEHLRELIFEKGVHLWTEIEGGWGSAWPFGNCPALESVTLPNYTGNILKDFFPSIAGCPNLREIITYPDNTDCIGKNGFFYKRMEEGSGFVMVCCLNKKENITVPGRVGGKRVKAVQLQAFSGCENLKHLVIGEGITELYGLVYGEVRTVRLPNSYRDTDIGLIVSNRNKAFERFVIKPDHPCFMEEDGFVYDKTGETLFFAPFGVGVCRVKEGVKKIAPFAFHAREGLKAVFLPESLEKIERDAFCHCTDLYYVPVPAGTEVEGGAFTGTDLNPLERKLFCLFTEEGMLPLPEDPLTAGPKGGFSPGPSDEELLQMHEDIKRMGFEAYDRQPQKPWWLIDFSREEQPEEKIEYDASDFVSMEDDEYSMYDEEFDIDFDEIP